MGLTTALLFGVAAARAQDRPPQGNFNPAQMRQRMMERLRDQMEVKDDSEWKAISERINKVMEARRALGGPGGPGGMGMGGPPPGGPPPGANGSEPGGPPPGSDLRDGPGGPPGGPGGPPGFSRENSPELDALRRAIEGKAPPAEIKARLSELRAARDKKEADLEKAREELRQVLSVRQEAVAVMMGLLK